MKTRTSFVANSSSSSFVLVGFPASQFEELYPDKNPDDEEFEFDDADDGEILGYRHLRINDYSIESTDARAFGEGIIQSVEALEALGFKDVKLYYGES